MSDTTRTKQLIKNVLIDLCQTQSFRNISVQKI
ncbi:TetR family transcriptional regulator, partial [Enterococcus faecalis]